MCSFDNHIVDSVSYGSILCTYMRLLPLSLLNVCDSVLNPKCVLIYICISLLVPVVIFFIEAHTMRAYHVSVLIFTRKTYTYDVFD